MHEPVGQQLQWQLQSCQPGVGVLLKAVLASCA